jgi:hypothetical protein
MYKRKKNGNVWTWKMKKIISVEEGEQKYTDWCTWNFENKQRNSHTEEDEYISGVWCQSEDDVYVAKVFKDKNYYAQSIILLSANIWKILEGTLAPQRWCSFQSNKWLLINT